MRLRPVAIYVWGAAGVPLFALALSLGGVLALSLWLAGGATALLGVKAAR